MSGDSAPASCDSSVVLRRQSSLWVLLARRRALLGVRRVRMPPKNLAATLAAKPGVFARKGHP